MNQTLKPMLISQQSAKDYPAVITSPNSQKATENEVEKSGLDTKEIRYDNLDSGVKILNIS